MAEVDDILQQMRNNPKGVRYRQLCKVCDCYFGTPRQRGTSHRIYRMPWPGDPRVNIQDEKGFAKPYQVRQVLKAIERLQNEKDKKR
jgi:hypothetical protein